MDIIEEPPPPRPSWHYVWDHGVWRATMLCPNGHFAYLGDHTIAPDGTVSPSVVCPHEGCGFHETVRLIGWNPNRPPI